VLADITVETCGALVTIKCLEAGGQITQAGLFVEKTIPERSSYLRRFLTMPHCPERP